MPDSVSTDDRVARLPENQLSNPSLAPAGHQLSEQVTSAQSSISPASPSSRDVTAITQLMDSITRAVEQLYTKRLGKRPKQVSCDLLSQRLVIWVEESITPVDKLLYTESDVQARLLCSTVDALLKKQIVRIIEQHVDAKVVALAFDTCYKQNCTGMIAKLSGKIQMP